MDGGEEGKGGRNEFGGECNAGVSGSERLGVVGARTVEVGWVGWGWGCGL